MVGGTLPANQPSLLWSVETGREVRRFQGRAIAANYQGLSIAFSPDGRFLAGGVGDKNGDNYSCRWSGFLQPTHSEEFMLTLEVNDGGRVWFDGPDRYEQHARYARSVVSSPGCV